MRLTPRLPPQRRVVLSLSYSHPLILSSFYHRHVARSREVLLTSASRRGEASWTLTIRRSMDQNLQELRGGHGESRPPLHPAPPPPPPHRLPPLLPGQLDVSSDPNFYSFPQIVHQTGPPRLLLLASFPSLSFLLLTLSNFN